MGLQGKIATEAMIWVLGSLCRRHRIPFDPILLIQQLPSAANDGYVLEELLVAADKLGLHVSQGRVSALNKAPDTAFPCLGFLSAQTSELTKPSELSPQNDLNGETTPTPPSIITPVLFVRQSDGVLAYFIPGNETPQRVDASETNPDLSPTAYSFLPKPEVLKDVDGNPADAKKEFGFAWFIPELRRHRNIWSEILLASLAIQLVGLATPLFTQVIIDKVVVHQTHSTLIVIGVALVMFMVFTSVMDLAASILGVAHWQSH